MSNPEFTPSYEHETHYGQVVQMPWYLRVVLGIVGLGMVILLVTAALLRPSEKGYGTHQQLGLPPCSFQVIFDGMPCPSCGMTTSWAHLTKGDVFSSLQANPGGTLLGLLSMVMGPWFMLTAIKGDWFYREPPVWLVLTVSAVLLTVIFSNWIFQLLK